ncbi:MAG: membrane protein insertase YidC [Acidobacteria bacterium]|nr:membrane protein insertase YidC [Acidobacteriota bacterium]
MERRVLLAVALSLLVLFAFRYLEERKMQRGPRQQEAVTRTSLPASPPAQSAPELPAEQPIEKPVSAGDTQAEIRQLVVDCDLYRAVLDNRGGLITSWQLKRHKSARGEVFEMISDGRNPEGRPYPGALVLDDAALGRTANNEPYAFEIVEGSGSELTFAPPVTVAMNLRRGDFSVEKRFRFFADNYVAEYIVAAERSGRPLQGRVLVGEDIGPEHEHLINTSVKLTAVYSLAGKVKRQDPPKEEKDIERISGGIGWVGLDMQYFAILAVPAGIALDAIEVQKRVAKTTGLDGKELSRELVRVMIPTNGAARLRFFVGPKEQAYLEKIQGADLQKVIDYGMFSFLVRPLLVSLKWLYKYVHNYGLAIILLTLLLTLLLFPFRLKQIVSMKKMAVVQPKIKAIQEKYKRYKATDPKRAEMNQEIMAIYKQHNVNPLGGCLPLLLQMPLLFAFYSLLAYSIELRQAPFVGWMQDLSAKDPYYVLPIVMGITMMISQKMTPMTPGADPTQAKVMMIMPAVFTVMFLNVSSGLNLYFLCSNIFQIGFQKIAERWIRDAPTQRRPKP